MPEWSPDELKRVLESKGFREERDRKHKTMYLYVEEKRTAIKTQISHGSKRKSVNRKSKLFGLIAKQLKLTRPQLEALLNCPLGYEEYLELLRERGVL